MVLVHGERLLLTGLQGGLYSSTLEEASLYWPFLDLY